MPRIGTKGEGTGLRSLISHLSARFWGFKNAEQGERDREPTLSNRQLVELNSLGNTWRLFEANPAVMGMRHPGERKRAVSQNHLTGGNARG